MTLDTSAYKQKLADALSRIIEELQTLGVHDPKNPQDWIPTPPVDEDGPDADPNDVADRVEESDEHTAILAPLERQYNDTSRALKKIKDGTYGACEACRKDIETDRLDANPAARTCKAHMEEEASLSQ